MWQRVLLTLFLVLSAWQIVIAILEEEYDADSKKVLRICEFDDKDTSDDTEIVCEYRQKISKEESQKSLLCWVKTSNVWNSEHRTACVSDVITIYSPSPSRDLSDTRRIVPKAVPKLKRKRLPKVVLLERPLVFGERYLTEIDTDDPEFNRTVWKTRQLPEPFGRYRVEVGPPSSVTNICSFDDEDGLTFHILMEFSGYARLNQTPQVMVWNSSILYKGKVGGFFTVFIRKVVVDTEGHVSFGENLKRCNRTQEAYEVPIKCSLVLPITDLDLGYHAFTTDFLYADTEEQMNDNKGFHCKVTKYISYFVSKDPTYVKERIIVKDEIVFNEVGRTRGGRRPFWAKGRGVRRRKKARGAGAGAGAGEEAGGEDYYDELEYPTFPWNTEPMEGPGVRLNGLQFLVLSMGVVSALLAFGFCWSGVATALRRRKEYMQAYHCRCKQRGCAKK